MESDEHGDFKVRLEMEENGENLDFLQEIDEDIFYWWDDWSFFNTQWCMMLVRPKIPKN